MSGAANGAPMTAVDIAAAVNAGRMTALEATEAALGRIEAEDPAVEAFLHVAAEAARARARAVDARRGANEAPGPLAGVPVGIKDNLCVAGMPCTCASKILDGYVPPYDATVVQRLNAAGAVVVGKTNLDEFAMGSSTENSAYRKTRNPWDLARVPGGSSGGSAAAVAARLVPLSLGSDTGGSVRQPAALTGVYALKPTYGRVSRYGLVAFASSLDQVGPFATTVADLAAIYHVIAGPDPCDSTSLPTPPAPFDLEAGVKGRVIAFPESVLNRPGLSPEVAAATRAAAATFEKLGARIETVDFPDLDAGIAAYYLVCTAEASSNLARYDGVRYGPRSAAKELGELYARTRHDGFGPEVKRRIMLGTFALSSGYYDAYYGRAMRACRTLKTRFQALFAKADLVLIPTTPTPAFRLGEKTEDPLEMYLADIFTVFANLIGAPALTMPGGFSSGGLPLGVQLVADDGHEDRLFTAARAFESVTDFHARRPAPASGGAK
jgi:aspartyl-tRNA(Asn)/glutamyl-tRNA(Gln) amidotransferase subunit A